jgi:hypothetical protein
MALCHGRVRELAIGPLMPMSVNSPGAIPDLAISVTEIERSTREGQGDFEVNADARLRYFTHCDPGAGQKRLPSAGYAMDLGQTLVVPLAVGSDSGVTGSLAHSVGRGAAGFSSSSSLQVSLCDAEDRPADLGAP